MTVEDRKAYDSYEYNKAINENIMRAKIEDGIEAGMSENEEKMVQAMKANGMSDAEIQKIIQSIQK